MTARTAGAEVSELGDVRGPMDRVDGPLEALTGEVESRGRHLVAEIVTAVERTTYATDLRICSPIRSP